MQALVTFHWRTSVIAGLALAGAVWAASALGVTHIDLPLMGTLVP